MAGRGWRGGERRTVTGDEQRARELTRSGKQKRHDSQTMGHARTTIATHPRTSEQPRAPTRFRPHPQLALALRPAARKVEFAGPRWCGRGDLPRFALRPIRCTPRPSTPSRLARRWSVRPRAPARWLWSDARRAGIPDERATPCRVASTHAGQSQRRGGGRPRAYARAFAARVRGQPPMHAHGITPSRERRWHGRSARVHTLARRPGVQLRVLVVPVSCLVRVRASAC